VDSKQVNQYVHLRSLNSPYSHGRRSRGGRRNKTPRIWSGGIVPQILSCCKILSTRLLALQCRKMCFLPLQQDFYSKSRHAYPPEFQSDLRLCLQPTLSRRRCRIARSCKEFSMLKCSIIPYFWIKNRLLWSKNLLSRLAHRRMHDQKVSRYTFLSFSFWIVANIIL